MTGRADASTRVNVPRMAIRQSTALQEPFGGARECERLVRGASSIASSLKRLMASSGDFDW